MHRLNSYAQVAIIITRVVAFNPRNNLVGIGHHALLITTIIMQIPFEMHNLVIVVHKPLVRIVEVVGTIRWRIVLIAPGVFVVVLVGMDVVMINMDIPNAAVYGFVEDLLEVHIHDPLHFLPHIIPSPEHLAMQMGPIASL